MPNQYTPQKKTIGELLSLTNPPVIVPDWQRNYSWTSSEAEIFWQDLLDFSNKYPDQNIDDQEYFLGSVVIVDINKSHLLLDGQQRLATAGIMLSLIRDYLAKFNKDAATRITTRYLTDFDDASNQRIFKLTLNVYDREFYKREVLEDRLADYVAPEPQIQSHKFIREVRDTFETHFSRKYAEINNPAIAHSWALRILQVLVNHVSVVAVISTDEDNAAAVFETLNDRGIGLSTPDLLRNFLMRRALEHEREEIIALWGNIFDLADDVKVDTFLRHYWLSKVGDVKTRSLYREIKAYILLHNESSLTFTRNLAEGAEVYKSLLTGQVDEEITSKYLKDIRELGANLLYPPLLSSITVYNNDDFTQICKSIIVLFVRYNLIGKLENSPLETFCYNIARDIRGGLSCNDAIQRMREILPSDNQFRHQFLQAVISRRDSARYILREIETKKRRTAELEVGPPSRVHIEHIYPQTPIEGQRWANHVSQINRIGNLTLLDRRLNAAIKNGNFDAKRPSYDLSEIMMTKELVAIEEWNQDSLELRQANLFNIAFEIWKLE
ncbi:MAG: hypothetical protein JWR61_3340 [Ferruginibacter sp.]|uniref:DUF262 domain-containing protein n=1 Tax=Ferruginibacter sp. TaxID=1940288 RepID=UPI00265A73AC|nr:DUF262 domain-containing protein [Ferruginibacter sp.]MDB5278385.1 hypothetical protein [Ferruginibacter sp.]